MVLPVRIELTTSALPRMRSTTELRQHFLRKPRAYDGAALALSTRACGAGARRHVAACGQDKEREERLAAALRENLRKRKAQVAPADRGRRGVSRHPADGLDPAHRVAGDALIRRSALDQSSGLSTTSPRARLPAPGDEEQGDDRSFGVRGMPGAGRVDRIVAGTERRFSIRCRPRAAGASVMWPWMQHTTSSPDGCISQLVHGSSNR